MSGWSQEQIDTFRRMRAKGKSYAQISVVIGKSRCAVAGRASREDGRDKNPINPRGVAPVFVPKRPRESWDERLFEPWAVRKARREMENRNDA